MSPAHPEGMLFRATRAAVIVCGWWLLAMVALTCLEILGRKFFAFSFQAVDELGAYTLAITSAFGFTLTLLNRGHTRVDFMMGRLTAGARAWLNAAAMLALAALALFAAWRGIAVLTESLEFKSTATTPLQTPLWIPQSLWLAGMLLFAFAASVLAGHALSLLFSDQAKLNKLYGPMTLDEEIQHEVATLEASIESEVHDLEDPAASPAVPLRGEGR
jgi:TRAP-type C4-dicarboxylate transport system permease small subunit